MRLPLAAAALLTLAACAAPSRATRVQEAAYELNIGLRFGYNAMALEKVASDDRKDFLRRHREWNHRVRIVDIDLAGMNIRDNDADVFVAVQWQNTDFSDVRTTIVHQRWKDNKGTWQLNGETRSQGDKGLFGDDERTAADSDPAAPAAPRDDAASRRYQTTIIR